MRKPSVQETDNRICLSSLEGIKQEIASAGSLSRLIAGLMERIGSIFDPVAGFLMLADPDTSELVCKGTVGAAASTFRDSRIPMNEGVAGWICRNGRPALVSDAARDPRFSDTLDTVTGLKTRSIIGVPLKADEKTVGVIELINRHDGRPFTEPDLQLLSVIAGIASLAMEREMYLQALGRLSRVDPLTGVENRRSFDTLLAAESERCRRYSTLLSILLMLNVFLGVFNLLPLPPLDGSAVLALVLSRDQALRLQEYTSQPWLQLLGLAVAWKLFPFLGGPLFSTVLRLLYF